MSAEKSLTQKLQIKKDRKVLLVNPPEGYLARLGELPSGVTVQSAPSEPVDIVQVFEENREDNAYAHALGMEGVAMISISDDWSALRLKVQ